MVWYPGLVAALLRAPEFAVVLQSSATDTLREWAYFIAIYGITIAVSIWVYRDARDRGNRWAPVWGIMGLVLPGIVHLTYFYLRVRADRDRAAA